MNNEEQSIDRYTIEHNKSISFMAKSMAVIATLIFTVGQNSQLIISRKHLDYFVFFLMFAMVVSYIWYLIRNRRIRTQYPPPEFKPKSVSPQKKRSACLFDFFLILFLLVFLALNILAVAATNERLMKFNVGLYIFIFLAQIIRFYMTTGRKPEHLKRIIPEVLLFIALVSMPYIINSVLGKTYDKYEMSFKVNVNKFEDLIELNKHLREEKRGIMKKNDFAGVYYYDCTILFKMEDYGRTGSIVDRATLKFEAYYSQFSGKLNCPGHEKPLREIREAVIDSPMIRTLEGGGEIVHRKGKAEISLMRLMLIAMTNLVLFYMLISEKELFPEL